MGFCLMSRKFNKECGSLQAYQPSLEIVDGGPNTFSNMWVNISICQYLITCAPSYLIFDSSFWSDWFLETELVLTGTRAIWSVPMKLYGEIWKACFSQRFANSYSSLNRVSALAVISPGDWSRNPSAMAFDRPFLSASLSLLPLLGMTF